jgi:hypothetical protein
VVVYDFPVFQPTFSVGAWIDFNVPVPPNCLNILDVIARLHVSPLAGAYPYPGIDSPNFMKLNSTPDVMYHYMLYNLVPGCHRCGEIIK